jgi:hypothetical protein
MRDLSEVKRTGGLRRPEARDHGSRWPHAHALHRQTQAKDEQRHALRKTNTCDEFRMSAERSSSILQCRPTIFVFTLPPS